MKRTLLYTILGILFFSCAEKVLEAPENLVTRDKMVDILTELAILNAAKSTKVSVLLEHNIQPMPYIFEKYGVDSVQFVQSDRYYASVPEVYEEIYLKVQDRLEKKHDVIQAAKKVNDSLKLLENEARSLAKKPGAKKRPTDSLP